MTDGEVERGAVSAVVVVELRAGDAQQRNARPIAWPIRQAEQAVDRAVIVFERLSPATADTGLDAEFITQAIEPGRAGEGERQSRAEREAVAVEDAGVGVDLLEEEELADADAQAGADREREVDVELRE